MEKLAHASSAFASFRGFPCVNGWHAYRTHHTAVRLQVDVFVLRRVRQWRSVPLTLRYRCQPARSTYTSRPAVTGEGQVLRS